VIPETHTIENQSGKQAVRCSACGKTPEVLHASDSKIVCEDDCRLCSKKEGRATLKVDPDLWREATVKLGRVDTEKDGEVYVSGLTPQEQADKMARERQRMNPK